MEEKIIFMGLVIIVLLTIVVLYLIVNDKNDTKAGEIFKEVFPDREIIPVNCLKLIEQGGSLHCSTMQVVY